MSILSDSAILAARERGEIKIEPWRPECLGSNSYDLHLGGWIATYDFDQIGAINSRAENGVKWVKFEGAFVMRPGMLYLGVTEEWTETLAHVPMCDGKSSVGRLGIKIHETAGKGDVGFRGHWTLEMTCVHPVWIYRGMPIAQIFYHTVEGHVLRPYGAKEGAKYAGSDEPRPVPSRMHLNWDEERKVWIR